MYTFVLDGILYNFNHSVLSFITLFRITSRFRDPNTINSSQCLQV